MHAMERTVLRRADGVLSVSEEVTQRLVALGADPAVILDERLDFLRGKRLNLFNPDGLP